MGNTVLCLSNTHTCTLVWLNWTGFNFYTARTPFSWVASCVILMCIQFLFIQALICNSHLHTRQLHSLALHQPCSMEQLAALHTSHHPIQPPHQRSTAQLTTISLCLLPPAQCLYHQLVELTALPLCQLTSSQCLYQQAQLAATSQIPSYSSQTPHPPLQHSTRCPPPLQYKLRPPWGHLTAGRPVWLVPLLEYAW